MASAVLNFQQLWRGCLGINISREPRHCRWSSALEQFDVKFSCCSNYKILSKTVVHYARTVRTTQCSSKYSRNTKKLDVTRWGALHYINLRRENRTQKFPSVLVHIFDDNGSPKTTPYL
jgi:hypothetical protein